jgi:hypothetical protein
LLHGHPVWMHQQEDRKDEPRQSKFDVRHLAEGPSLVLQAHGLGGPEAAEGETHAAPVFPRSRSSRARRRRRARRHPHARSRRFRGRPGRRGHGIRPVLCPAGCPPQAGSDLVRSRQPGAPRGPSRRGGARACATHPGRNGGDRAVRPALPGGWRRVHDHDGTCRARWR